MDIKEYLRNRLLMRIFGANIQTFFKQVMHEKVVYTWADHLIPGMIFFMGE